jgi:selenocysteine lyase/cysteine desulfurase
VRVVPAAGTPNGLIALAVDGAGEADELTRRLAERRVLIRSIPGTPWLRVSVGAWTADEDIEMLIDALR